MKKYRLRSKTASAAICIAAALVFGDAASADSTPTTIDVQKTLSVLPPFPKQVVDEVDFSQTVPGPYAYYHMCHQPADAFRCTLDKKPAPNHKPRALTRMDWIVMHHVLNELHRSFKPTTDIEKYGREDVWTHNSEGDCEDFAWLFKRILTRRYDWAEHELLMGVVWDENKAGHAVMVIRSDRGYWVADVRRNHFRLMEETNYDAHMIQMPENRYKWASISGRTIFAQTSPWQARVKPATITKKFPRHAKKPTVALRGTLP